MHALGWIALGLVGCASMQVDWEQDPAIPLSACETYAWIPAPAEAPGTWRETLAALEPVLESAVELNLAGHGLRPDPETPDLRVRAQLLVEERTTTTVLESFGDPRLGGQRGELVEYVFVFEEGSVVIDVLPPDRSAVAWRGWAVAEVDPELPIDDRRPRVEEAVRRILAEFPCRPAPR